MRKTNRFIVRSSLAFWTGLVLSGTISSVSNSTASALADDEIFDEYVKEAKDRSNTIEHRALACEELCKRGPMKQAAPVCKEFLDEILEQVRQDEDGLPVLKAGVSDRVVSVAKALAKSGGRDAAPVVPALLRSIALMRRAEDQDFGFLTPLGRLPYIAPDYPEIQGRDGTTHEAGGYPGLPPINLEVLPKPKVYYRSESQTEVAQCLVGLATERDVEGLIRMMETDPYIGVQVAMVAALEATRSAKAIVPLSKGLKAKDWTLRAACAKALGRIGSEKDIPKLEVMAKLDKEAGSSASRAIALIRERAGQPAREPAHPEPAGEKPRAELAPPRVELSRASGTKGAAAIRLTYFDRTTDAIVDQEPDESDEDFAGRLRRRLEAAQLDGSDMPDVIRSRRRKIEADWPTTQAKQDLKTLRPEREVEEGERDDAELEVAKFRTLVAGNPRSLTDRPFLVAARGRLARCKERLAALDVRIARAETESTSRAR